MGFREFLGNISPVYGLTTGRGFYGSKLNPTEFSRLEQEKQQRENAAINQAEEQANIARQNQIAAQYQGGMKKGGKVSSASKRADGIAQRGKTRGKIV